MKAYRAFADACDIVARQLPDTLVTFEWPGTIDVLVRNDRLLIFGIVNETLDANVSVLNGDLWDYDDAVLVTDVSSATASAEEFASAIIDRVRRYQPGDSD